MEALARGPHNHSLYGLTTKTWNTFGHSHVSTPGRPGGLCFSPVLTFLSPTDQDHGTWNRMRSPSSSTPQRRRKTPDSFSHLPTWSGPSSGRPKMQYMHFQYFPCVPSQACMLQPGVPSPARCALFPSLCFGCARPPPLFHHSAWVELIASFPFWPTHLLLSTHWWFILFSGHYLRQWLWSPCCWTIEFDKLV